MAEVLVQGYTPEKSTDQLAVWQSLIDTLARLDADWKKAQPTGPRTQASSQLPANIVVTLAQAGAHGARVLAGVADILANQFDTGEGFRELALAQQQVADSWPAR
ncbi:MAG: hypothetical protein H0V41_01205, partial [Pseudonocardiales bacterium]|nr:hypothetical protein [Pseudonocardiales bacterium]